MIQTWRTLSNEGLVRRSSMRPDDFMTRPSDGTRGRGCRIQVIRIGLFLVMSQEVELQEAPLQIGQAPLMSEKWGNSGRIAY